MTQQVDPSLNRRKLRLALRRAREQAHLSQREAAEQVEWSQSKLIRVETGTVGVSVSDLRALLGLYGVDDPEQVEDLEQAARGSKGPSWWSSYHEVITPQYAQYLGYEGAAESLHTYHPIVVPGHLQTRAYAEALLGPRDLEENMFRRVVDLRMERQQRMFDDSDRPACVFVLDEAAVRRQVGGKEVLAEQLSFLLELGSRPKVSVRVLPFEAGAHYSTLGSFVLLGFADDDDLLYLEHAAGSMTGGEDLRLLARYQECFRTITDMALDEPESADLISRVRQDLGVH
ncbi:helix-turn-helix transcriptional regulator [Streptomyces longwoodensis]|jgi:transcriptional regulator with XRE-family HTH domain|uniref:XRE family transcriptional regulator n=1 Tax=Streptomyces longwoodensis TaxID=68231 RepID=A0A101QTC3_9ACTN|nr:helix-turn-helix transcriptional regulator [Streptomyces longwoodensis]KUN35764.1 XRE family transcriptional regulator [Streptomyces longwoodensis]MCX5000830.1 helix-turn-helix domain-containing protein [Streptomyces longwoodensis]WRY92787.1 helix-turn-helix domain-containing protein [Streptomyces longwoodensis]WUC55671.1 helix-turn-helix domain-containing protein [Streptomyces longwoodensis]WUC62210.1 helix-turn-helix domain-containing protein [Streptomyces longwoodensis]